MIKIFTGDDRVKAKAEIAKFLGEDYEVIEGGEVTPMDMPTIFQGMSLLSAERKILIRDLLANKAVVYELEKYLETPHKIALFETKIDKRGAVYKAVRDKIEVKEYKLPEVDLRAVFEIYRTAKRDGKKALLLLESVKSNEEPVMFMGLMVSQALKDFAMRPGAGERRALKSLARADMAMKTTGIDPWLVVESFLLGLSEKIKG